MMSWKIIKLKDILKQRKNKITISDNDFYTLVTISNKGIIKKRKIELGQNIKAKTAYIISSGNFIYSRLSIHNGAFGLIPTDLDGAIVTNEMPYFSISNEILPEFLIFSLKLPDFKFQLKQLTKGVGRTRVKEKDFLELYIKLPTIDIQKKIIKYINEIESIYLSISTELTHQLDLVKKLRQEFLREAMQGKLTADWRKQNPNVEPATELLAKIKAEKEKLIKKKKIKKQKPLPPITQEEIPFEIPENWMWTRLGEIGVCQTGTTPSTKIKKYFGNDIPFIKPADISLKGIRLDNEGLSFEGLKKGVLVPKNSLLMVCIGGSIGKSYFNEVDVSCNQQINTITPLKDIKSNFLQNWLQSDYFQQSIWEKASGGTTPIVNRSKWESIPIPLPPLSEQKAIVAKLDELMAYCDSLEESIKNSQKQNEMLLQQVLREALEPKEITEKE